MQTREEIIDVDSFARRHIGPSPRDVAAIEVLPRDEAGARVGAIVVNGRRFAVPPSGAPGWMHLRLGLKDAELAEMGAEIGIEGIGSGAARTPGRAGDLEEHRCVIILPSAVLENKALGTGEEWVFVVLSSPAALD